MSVGAEEAADNVLELECQHNVHKNRLQLKSIPRDAQEIFEADSLISSVDKFSKPVCNQRISNRLTKRNRQDSSPVDPSSVKKAVTGKQNVPLAASKTRRPWELWSVEDKNAFFEALCEFGKDFESIQSYIAQRSKKKGISANMIKNKDQVRHFYYRTWHKISKFLDVGECVGKQTQELYGLINYAELRKKIGGCLSEKNRQKLNELVFNGVTTVKYKGKKLRIKTPVCRALKKLNNVSDTKEPDAEKLPKEIFVEFKPYSNSDLLFVQNLAQNPKVRIKVTLQRRLRTVIEFLQNKWKPHRLKKKEQIVSSLPYSMLEDELPCDKSPTLRVKPPRDAKIFSLMLSPIDIASSSDVCLEKYMKSSTDIFHKDISKTKTTLSLNQKLDNDQISDIEGKITDIDPLSKTTDCTVENELDNTHINDVHTQPDLQESTPKYCKSINDLEANYENLLTPPMSVPEDNFMEQNVFSKPISIFSHVLESTFENKHGDRDNAEVCTKENDNFSLKNASKQNNDIQSESSIETENDCSSKESHSSVSHNEVTESSNLAKAFHIDTKNCQETLCAIENVNVSNLHSHLDDFKDNEVSNESIYYKTVQNGWTFEDAGYLTFGEVFLLLGKPSTIILEYEFLCSSSLFLNETEASTNKHTLTQVSEIAQSYFMEAKHKSQILKKQSNRMTIKSSKSKTGICEKIQNINLCTISMKKETSLNNESVGNGNSAATDSTSSDKHVFVMPVGTAPRNVKPPDQNLLKEEIGKLLPGTRRGCRVRRKPLVVQRPLLPREGMRTITGSRAMTLVHFVPSVSSIAAVIPTNTSPQENKINIQPTKNVVKILPAVTPLDMHPIQVPLIQQIHTDPTQNVMLKPTSVPSHVILNSPATNVQMLNEQTIPCQLPGTNSSVSSASSPSVLSESTPSGSSSLIPDVNMESLPRLSNINLDVLTESQKPLLLSENNFDSSFSNLSLHNLSESSNMSSCSFLDDLSFSPSKSNLYDTSAPTCFNEDSSSASKQTHPVSPTRLQFQISSPDIQWLNGDSADLSLNTFLNSMESSMKGSSSIAYQSENSNLDSMGRLAPVVDSQVQSLLDECSIDFITKFEDLADVINNSNSEKKTP